MKKLLIFCLLLFGVQCIAQNYCVITLKNGKKYITDTEKLDSIGFSEIVDIDSVQHVGTDESIFDSLKSEINNHCESISTIYVEIDSICSKLSNTEKICELEQQMVDISSTFNNSVNLYNYTKRTKTSVISANGQIVTLETYTTDTSDFIKVDSGKTVFFSVNGIVGSIKRYAFYNSKKEYIEGSYVKSEVSNVVIPSGVSYIRFTGNSSYMGGLFQAQYTEVTSYEPYGYRSIRDVFVSNSGNDDNEGTKNAPYKTILKAIGSGAETIYIAADTYTENIVVRNKRISFCVYNGEHFTIDASSTTSPAIRAEECNIFINGMIACNTTNGRNGFELLGCTGTVKNCEAYNCAKDGFELGGSSLDLYNCYSHDNSVDGIGAHTYEDYKANVSAHNCVCKNNADDGLSFHGNECCNIYGGEFSNNTNGGVVPYGQSVINVYNAIIEGNDIGVYAFQSGDILSNPRIITNGNLIKGNRLGIRVQYYDIISINDHIVESSENEKSSVNGSITSY